MGGWDIDDEECLGDVGKRELWLLGFPADCQWAEGDGVKSLKAEVDALKDDGVDGWYVDDEECLGNVGKRGLWSLMLPLDDSSRWIRPSCRRLRSSATLSSLSRRCCSLVWNSFCDRRSAISACMDSCARLDSSTACHSVGMDISTPCGTNTCPLQLDRSCACHWRAPSGKSTVGRSSVSRRAVPSIEVLTIIPEPLG